MIVVVAVSQALMPRVFTSGLFPRAEWICVHRIMEASVVN